MVTKFRSEYGNLDLQRNRGKYENRPDLKKGERERRGEKMERRWKANRLENLISELHRLRLARSSSVRKLRAGIVIRSGRRCAEFIPSPGRDEQDEQGGKISLNTLRAWNSVKKLDGGGEIRDTNLQLFTDASFVFFQFRVGRMLVFPVSFFSF